MKILFDVTAVQPSQGKFHGASEYAKSLFERLMINRSDEIIECVYNPDEWLDPVFADLMKSNSILLHKARTAADIEKIISSGKYSLFYSALPYRYHSNVFECRSVFTVHGLRDLEMPSDSFEWRYSSGIISRIKIAVKRILPSFYKQIQLKRLASLVIGKNRNVRIITVSQHSKYSLLSFLPELKPSDITVLYPPEKIIYSQPASDVEIMTKFKIESKNYYLIISANRWVKNSYRAMKALDSLYSSNSNFKSKTVVVGSGKKRLPRIKLNNKNMFIFTSYLSDSELDFMYKNARALVYPTVNEGFGYPPVEAMRHGTPVLCSSIASTSEVCSNSAIYFNPFSIDEIKNRLLMIESENDIREKYSFLSLQRYREVSHKQSDDLDKLCFIILGKA
ncbi:MAG TPA: glycosyltransferase [Spirochaetota bacterium]|nr:glycosyltransferase [Spirochaetota bacterium]HOR45259.1 glycosyltransferase [Spirochaetota bacterium]HPK57479.1 glycosyltransferase [Spirochaetota bacterium]